MAPGLHESETVFAFIARFLYADEQASTAAVNSRTWQEQRSNTASIKEDYERWRDWVTDKHYEEWCRNEDDQAAREYFRTARDYYPNRRSANEHFLSNTHHLREQQQLRWQQLRDNCAPTDTTS